MTGPSTAPPTGPMPGSAGRPDVVVLMAYGTPSSPGQVEAYYTDIRRGHPPSAEQLADLQSRYAAIGGMSPLTRRSEAQRDALQAALDSAAPGAYSVTLGYKHVAPRIADAVADALAAGAQRLVGVVLAPHFSQASVGGYLAQLEGAAGDTGSVSITSWATLPEFVQFLAHDVVHQLRSMPPGTRVVFTAHSLPRRVIDGGDPYVHEVTATARAVADAAGLTDGSWQVGWQSAGRTADAWLEPDILAIVDDLAADAVPGVVVCACGFVSDHLEVLYDLDIAARERAAALGMAFARTGCVNDDPAVFTGLARLVLESGRPTPEGFR